jgi:dienelactone hydrolase
MRHTAIEFRSEGAVLRGFILLPDYASAANPVPAIVAVLGAGQVVANGDSATVTLPFVDAGFAVLLWDHRGFGESGGDRRQEINPWIQRRATIDALSFVESEVPEVDNNRLGLIGVSMSGSAVASVAAVDSRVRAAVMFVPDLGSKWSEKGDASGAKFEDIRTWLCDRSVDVEGDVDVKGEVVGPMPLAGASAQSGALVVGLEVFAQSVAYAGRNPKSKWQNECTLVAKGPNRVSPFQSPQWCAPHIQCPVAVFVAEDDSAVSAEVARRVAGTMPDAAVFEIPGGHFGWYVPVPVLACYATLLTAHLLDCFSACSGGSRLMFVNCFVRLWWPCTLLERMTRTAADFFLTKLARTQDSYAPQDFSGAWVRGEKVEGNSHGDERIGFIWQHTAAGSKL